MARQGEIDVTGIVVADEQRLILRPQPVLLRRRGLLWALAAFTCVAAAVAVGLAYVFRAHVTYLRAVLAAVAVALVYSLRFTTQVTFIALATSDGIYVETKNRIARTKRRRLLHRYADIRAVRLRSRINPNTARSGVSPGGAYVHYDVVLEKRTGTELLWYTRYPEAAAQIAQTIAGFARVAVEGAPVSGAAG